MARCKECKQDTMDFRRVEMLRKETFRLRQLAKQLAKAETLQERDAIAIENEVLIVGDT